MLIITRRPGERLVLGDDIRIELIEIAGQHRAPGRGRPARDPRVPRGAVAGRQAGERGRRTDGRPARARAGARPRGLGSLPRGLALGTFIGVGRSLETALQRVELAERLGYESAYVTHIAARDSVTTLMAYAAAQRARSGSAPA